MNKEEIFKVEIDYVFNTKLKENLKTLVNLLPDYFFVIEASSTGKYHPSYALGEGGLLRHTKAAVRIAFELLLLTLGLFKDVSEINIKMGKTEKVVKIKKEKKNEKELEEK